MKNTKILALFVAALSLTACQGPSKAGVKSSLKREKCSIKAGSGDFQRPLSRCSAEGGNHHSTRGYFPLGSLSDAPITRDSDDQGQTYVQC